MEKLTLKQAHIHTEYVVAKVAELNQAIMAATRAGLDAEILIIQSEPIQGRAGPAHVHVNVRCNVNNIDIED